MSSPTITDTPKSSPDMNVLGVQHKGTLRTDQPFVQSTSFEQLSDPDLRMKIKMMPNTGPLHLDRVKDKGIFKCKSSETSQSPTTSQS